MFYENNKKGSKIVISSHFTPSINIFKLDETEVVPSKGKVKEIASLIKEKYPLLDDSTLAENVLKYFEEITKS